MIRIEKFLSGFMTSMKPQLDPLDRELLALIFSGTTPSSFASTEEKNPNKPAYYFRFGAPHLNVLLPVWLLNGKSVTKTDRFRVACTDDHSLIFDTKESIFYDPTTEMIHGIFDYKPLWMNADWKEETSLRFRDELQAKRLKILGLADRLENFPSLYEKFSQFIVKHRLRQQVPAFRFGLKIGPGEAPADDLIQLALAELWERNQARSAA